MDMACIYVCVGGWMVGRIDDNGVAKMKINFDVEWWWKAVQMENIKIEKREKYAHS